MHELLQRQPQAGAVCMASPHLLAHQHPIYHTIHRTESCIML